jgi:hypothetical protein
MSGTWSDGRREPLLEYFDARRGYKAQRPKPRKDRTPEPVFPFGTGHGTGRVVFDSVPGWAYGDTQASPARRSGILDDQSARLPARPVLTLRSAARAASYGSL